MRSLLIFATPAALLAVVCLSAAQDKAPAKSSTKSGDKPAAKATPKGAEKPAAKAPAVKPQGAAKPQAANEKYKADEAAIRETADDYAKAWSLGNVKAVAGHFTEDAEYVDEMGRVYVGRDAIAAELAELFNVEQGSKLEIEIGSVRFIAPGIAVEDGLATITPPKGAKPFKTLYTATHVKVDDEWLIASIRDQVPTGGRPHREILKELDWLVGDWIDEDADSVLVFSCKPVDGGTFLLREFTVKLAGVDAITGSQRIGFDPLAGRLRAWTFDSEGGFSEGVWHRDGQSWVLTSTGVTADGETTSATSVFTPAGAHSMTWQVVDLVIAGQRFPDSELFKFVRKPPESKR